MENKSIGQLILIGIQGKALTADEKKFIVTNNISGVTLFGRNYENPKQLHDLCSEIQSLRFQMANKSPLFIGIDMEGGRVHRLKEPFTQWPAIQKLGQLDNPTLTFHFAQKMGLELKSFGINLDYAPCVDIFSNPENKVIGDRSIGSDPELVGKHASALVRGYIKSDVIPCVKHFPGHGNTFLDSHFDLPSESADLKRLESFEFIPFKRAFKARVEMCMTSHILFPNLDPQYPATLSEYIIKKILKDQCRFRGLVITDDLDMHALSKNFSVSEIPIKAIQAGCDLLLYCNEPLSPVYAVESIQKAISDKVLDKNYIDNQASKILKFKSENIQKPDPLPFAEAMSVIENQKHKKISQAIKEGLISEDLLKDET